MPSEMRFGCGEWKPGSKPDPTPNPRPPNCTKCGGGGGGGGKCPGATCTPTRPFPPHLDKFCCVCYSVWVGAPLIMGCFPEGNIPVSMVAMGSCDHLSIEECEKVCDRRVVDICPDKTELKWKCVALNQRVCLQGDPKTDPGFKYDTEQLCLDSPECNYIPDPGFKCDYEKAECVTCDFRTDPNCLYRELKDCELACDYEPDVQGWECVNPIQNYCRPCSIKTNPNCIYSDQQKCRNQCSEEPPVGYRCIDPVQSHCETCTLGEPGCTHTTLEDCRESPECLPGDLGSAGGWRCIGPGHCKSCDWGSPGCNHQTRNSCLESPECLDPNKNLGVDLRWKCLGYGKCEQGDAYKNPAYTYVNEEDCIDKCDYQLGGDPLVINVTDVVFRKRFPGGAILGEGKGDPGGYVKGEIPSVVVVEKGDPGGYTRPLLNTSIEQGHSHTYSEGDTKTSADSSPIVGDDPHSHTIPSEGEWTEIAHNHRHQLPNRLGQSFGSGGRDVEVIDIDREVQGAQLSEGDYEGKNTELLYHPRFNFFSFKSRNAPYSEFVGNSSDFTNIFADLVSPHIRYITEHLDDDTSPWSEFELNQITLDMVGTSLSEPLNTAFKSIYTSEGFSIPQTSFQKGIWKHIVHKTLDRVDVNYFQEVADAQKFDPLTTVIQSESPVVNIQAALGEVASEMIPVDPLKYFQEFRDRHFIERYRTLPTDIEASIPVTLVSEAVVAAALEDAGFSITTAADVASHVPLGEGSGDYLTVTMVDETEAPLILNTSVSSSFYIPSHIREKTFSILGASKEVTFSMTSVSGASELNYGNYTLEATGATPLYFIADLSSVTETKTDDPLIKATTATYRLETDTDKINAHAKNYANGNLIVNINYDDPAYVYAQESGALAASMNNITFKNFTPANTSFTSSSDRRRAKETDNILIRSFPNPIIINPGCGSKHNIFNAESEIESIDSVSSVTRTFVQGPRPKDASTDLEDLENNGMTEKHLYNTCGVGYIGLVEKLSLDLERKFYEFDSTGGAFQNTYYYDIEGTGLAKFGDSAYTSNPPTSRRLPIAGRLVEVIETINNRYTLDNKVLTWWDLFRRLTYTEFAQLLSDGSEYFLSLVEDGLVESIKFRNVLNRNTAGETGIVSTKDEDTDDIGPYLDEEDRENLTVGDVTY